MSEHSFCVEKKLKQENALARYLQLNPEDNRDQFNTKADSQPNVQSKQDGCHTGDQPNQLGERRKKKKYI